MNRNKFMDYLLEKGKCNRFDEHQIDALEQFCFELYENTHLDNPAERIKELEKDLAFYKCCMLSGEIAEPKDTPSYRAKEQNE